MIVSRKPTLFGRLMVWLPLPFRWKVFAHDVRHHGWKVARSWWRQRG